jgi:hypothetical protein
MISNQLLIFLLITTGILILVVSLTQQYSVSETSVDYFSLSCNNITSQVNQLLESKGALQRNMLDLKNMTFLMNLYTMKCGEP